MKKILFILLLIHNSLFSQSLLDSFSIKYPKVELQEDFNQMITELKTNPAFYQYATEAEWESLIKNQNNQILDSLLLQDFYKLCMPIVAKLGCVHTVLIDKRFEKLGDTLVYLPFEVFIENNRIYVLKSLIQNTSITPGSEIIEINGKLVSEIIDEVWNMIPADGYNASYKKNIFSEGFAYFYHSIYGLKNEYNILYKPYKSESLQNEILKISEFIPIREKNTNNSNLNLSLNKELSTAIITIKSFNYYNEVNKFKSFIDSCFKEIRVDKIKNIVIDLRGNQGGDPYCSSYVLRNLMSKKINRYYIKDYGYYPQLIKPLSPIKNNLKEKPYILIDGLGLSSTGQLCALIKNNNLGIFVGEETGSTYTCNGAQKFVQLKNTNFVLQVGQLTFEVDAKNLDKKRGIIPDYIIIPSIQNRIDNQDVVLDFIKQKVKEKLSQNPK
jgi:hypothetical protein